jgi:hypothetical protein
MKINLWDKIGQIQLTKAIAKMNQRMSKIKSWILKNQLIKT